MLLPRLTSLRAFAAFAVFAFHAQRWDIWHPVQLFGAGYAGVTFFFALSGFVLAWSTPPDGRALDFYRRRFARVYPNHFVMLLGAAVLPMVAVGKSLAAAMLSLGLLQAWFPWQHFAYGMNDVSWSLSCEAAFYAAFPLALVWLRSARRQVRWMSAGGYAAAAGLFMLIGLSHGGVIHTVAYSHPLAHFGEFLLGMVAALEVRDGWRPRIPVSVAALLVLAGGFLTRQTASASVVLLVPFLLLVIAAAIADVQRKPGWLASRWLVYAGEVSFAFYLVHELVMMNVAVRHGLVGGGMFLSLFLIAAGCAVGLHHLVERPAQRWLRSQGRVRVHASMLRKEAAQSPVIKPM